MPLGLCPVCTHSQQAAIDERLRAGETLWPLVRECALRSSDLAHHRDDHVLHREGRPRRRVSSP